MSFRSHSLPGQVYSSLELQLIQRVFDTISAESLVPASLEERQHFGAYLIAMYAKGLCVEDRLLAFGRAAAKHHYPSISTPLMAETVPRA